MKIHDITTTLLSVPLPEKDWLRWSGGSARVMHATLVQVYTDEDISGLADVYCGLLAPGVVSSLVDHFKEQLVGRDPLQIQALWSSMYKSSLFWGKTGIAIAVISGIENALWDIAGKALGVPVYQLLGGLAHEKLPIYASGGMDKPKQALIQEFDEYKRKGFRAVKIRIGHTLDRDREKVRLAREVLGDDIEVMVDAVQGHNPQPWTSADAIVVARALEEFRPAWFEEPCANTDYEGYHRVRLATTIPVAGGESSTTIHEFKRFFERNALDVVQPDVTHAGGILECKKIAALAEADSVRLAPHSWGSGAVLAANCHFAFSTPNCWILEYPTWGFPLRDELLLEPLVIEDGYLYPPTTPGLGITLRREIIEKYPYRSGCMVEMKNTMEG